MPSSAWPLVAAIAIVATRIPRGGGLIPEEARYAELAREIGQGGLGLVPRLNGVLYFEKPPLLAWLGALVLPFDSIGDGSILRWIPAATSLVACAAFFTLARRHGGSELGWGATLLYATLPLGFGFAQTFSTDGPFADALTVAWCLSARGRLAAVASAVALASAALFRSPLLTAALYLPGAWILGTRTGGWRRFAQPLLPLTAGLALAAPWFVAMQWRESSFFKEFFVRQHFGRISPDEGDKPLHAESWSYYVPIVVGGLGIFGPAALCAALRTLKPRSDPAARSSLLVAGFVLAVFSAIGGKRAPYILPVFPWLALTTAAVWLEEGRAVRPSKLWRACLFAGALPAAALAGAGALAVLEPPFLGAVARSLVVAGFLAAGPVSALTLQRLGGFRSLVLAGSGMAACFVGARLGLEALDRRWSADAFAADAPKMAANLVVKALGRTLTIPITDAAIAPLCQGIARRAAEEDDVACLGRFVPALPFYTRRFATIVGGRGELAHGAARENNSPEVHVRFPSIEAFRARWTGERRIWAIGRASTLFSPAIRADVVPNAFVTADLRPYDGLRVAVLARSQDWVVVSNRP